MNSTDAVVLSLVLPTYNESQNLPKAIPRIVAALEGVALPFEVIVVDDDSPDGTWKLAQDLGLADSRIRCVRRQGERGLATAVAAGWKVARGAILGVMDADLQYPPETLPTLVKALDQRGVDIAICSRYAPGATVQEWSAMRWVISWGARRIGRLVLPTALERIADPGAGYFLLWRSVIEGITLQPRGFKILIEVLARGRYQRVVEVGLPYEGRKEGQSKLRSRQVVDYLAHLLDLSRDTGEWARAATRAATAAGATALGLGVLWLATARGGVHYVASAALGAEVAILLAFAGSELARRHRFRGGQPLPRGWLRRLGHWNRQRLAGAAAGLAVLWALTAGAGIHYLWSALIALPLAAAIGEIARVALESSVRSRE
jgi:dolichol-phosphate mannosyltransferase